MESLDSAEGGGGRGAPRRELAHRGAAAVRDEDRRRPPSKARALGTVQPREANLQLALDPPGVNTLTVPTLSSWPRRGRRPARRPRLRERSVR